MRGLLLAGALEASVFLTEFWALFRTSTRALDGLRVFDPFAGGGTTLVEAARLGATPCGVDVDPLAVKIVQHELDPPEPSDVAAQGAALLAYLEAAAGPLYAPTRKGWVRNGTTRIQSVSRRAHQCHSLRTRIICCVIGAGLCPRSLTRDQLTRNEPPVGCARSSVKRPHSACRGGSTLSKTGDACGPYRELHPRRSEFHGRAPRVFTHAFALVTGQQRYAAMK